MRFLFLLASLIGCSAASANIGPQGFGEFLNPIFIETGSYGGEGIAKALKAGFQRVRSIEYDNRLFNGCKHRFQNYSNVELFQGDSSKDLWKMIEDIDEPITFWLDAHVCPAREDGGKNCPLIEELEQIKWHPIKNHTILIDDMHCCGTILFDYLTHEDLIDKILEINPLYEITYVPGGDDGEYPINVMVARVPNQS